MLHLDFLVDSIQAVETPEALIRSLGVTLVEVHKGRDDYLAILEKEDSILSLSLDMHALSMLPSSGVMVPA